MSFRRRFERCAVCKAPITPLPCGAFLPGAIGCGADESVARLRNTMAENQGGAAVQEQEQAFDYPIRVEDAGPATKKVHVEIPAERITAKLEESFKELRQQAAIPGFRVGHAPQKLIEKRFSQDVKEQVRRQLISESYEQAVEKNNLQIIGEPEFDNPDAIKLPEAGNLTYSFQVEVQPEFE